MPKQGKASKKKGEQAASTVQMPEIAVSKEGNESEDDIISDNEDELRLRQVAADRRHSSGGLNPEQIGARLRRASIKAGVDPSIAENLANCVGAGGTGRASMVTSATDGPATDFGIAVPSAQAPTRRNEKGESADKGAAGAAAGAAMTTRPNATTAVAAPANTGSMFRYQKFKECPAKRPLTVCIDIPGVNVTHREVKDAVDDAIMFLKMNVFAKVHAIQFVARTVILGTPVCKNRWLVTLGDAHTMHELIIAGVNIQGEQIPVRRYDTVMSEEYKIYLQLRALEEEMGKSRDDDDDDDL